MMKIAGYLQIFGAGVIVCLIMYWHYNPTASPYYAGGLATLGKYLNLMFGLSGFAVALVISGLVFLFIEP